MLRCCWTAGARMLHVWGACADGAISGASVGLAWLTNLRAGRPLRLFGKCTACKLVRCRAEDEASMPTRSSAGICTLMDLNASVLSFSGTTPGTRTPTIRCGAPLQQDVSFVVGSCKLTQVSRPQARTYRAAAGNGCLKCGSLTC